MSEGDIRGIEMRGAITYSIRTVVNGVRIWDDFSGMRGHLRSRWVA